MEPEGTDLQSAAFDHFAIPPKSGADRGSRTPNLLIHTTIAFTTIKNVCSLDFLLIISYDLDSSYKVSTLGINLARDCHINYIAFCLFDHVLY